MVKLNEIKFWDVNTLRAIANPCLSLSHPHLSPFLLSPTPSIPKKNINKTNSFASARWS